MPDKLTEQIHAIGQQIAHVRRDIDAAMAQSPRSQKHINELRAELKMLYERYSILVANR